MLVELHSVYWVYLNNQKREKLKKNSITIDIEEN